MGRGSSIDSAAVSLAGRYDLLVEAPGGDTWTGKSWADHIRDVKRTRLLMIELLEGGGALDTDALRAGAVESGGSADEVVPAQVQLIRQKVIIKGGDQCWRLTSDATLIEEWRALSAA